MTDSVLKQDLDLDLAKLLMSKNLTTGLHLKHTEERERERERERDLELELENFIFQGL